jgi:hypothetical protein
MWLEWKKIMEGFGPIYNIKLTDDIVQKLKNHFKWTMFTEGVALVHETPSGGVHYTGKAKYNKAISFEVTRGGTYIIVSLFEYPKGVILHTHIFWPQISKANKEVIRKIYEEVKYVLGIKKEYKTLMI